MNWVMVLTVVSLVAAMAVFVHSLVGLQRLPESRDHRPVAPVTALALAFTLIKLQVVLGVPELMPHVRELAILLWELAALVEMWILMHHYTKCRRSCDTPTKKPLD